MSNRIACIGSINKDDVFLAGGNNASQGKHISYLSALNLNVPGGFATTTDAFTEFLEFNGLTDWIESQLEQLDLRDENQLAEMGKSIRKKIIHGCMPEELAEEVSFAYKSMISSNTRLPLVEVKASTTNENIFDDYFTEQQLSFFNIKGVNNIIDAIKKVYASLFTDKGITEQIHKNISISEIAISVTIQHMASSDDGRENIIQSIHKSSKKIDRKNIAPGAGDVIQLGYYTPTQRFTVMQK